VLSHLLEGRDEFSRSHLRRGIKLDGFRLCQ
jgi:hypothetical protein